MSNESLEAMFVSECEQEPFQSEREKKDSLLRDFSVGDIIRAQDSVRKWLEAEVLSVDFGSKRILIHYLGWSNRWDEWLDFGSIRIVGRFEHEFRNSKFDDYEKQLRD